MPTKKSPSRMRLRMRSPARKSPKKSPLRLRMRSPARKSPKKSPLRLRMSSCSMRMRSPARKSPKKSLRMRFPVVDYNTYFRTKFRELRITHPNLPVSQQMIMVANSWRELHPERYR